MVFLNSFQLLLSETKKTTVFLIHVVTIVQSLNKIQNKEIISLAIATYNDNFIF